MGNKNPVPADHESLDARYLGSCVNACVEDLEAYDATEKETNHRGMRRYFTRGEYNALSELFKYEIDPRSGLTMKKDWHIRYGYGMYQGQNVICIHHSAIHHFYTIPKDTRYAN
ncbi:MAG: hypothetical protein RR280_01020 [Bacteroidaceae bacterium]